MFAKSASSNTGADRALLITMRITQYTPLLQNFKSVAKKCEKNIFGKIFNSDLKRAQNVLYIGQ